MTFYSTEVDFTGNVRVLIVYLTYFFLTISFVNGVKGPCQSVKVKGQSLHHDLLPQLKTQ